MDALRKAEQAKRQAQEGALAEPDAFSATSESAATAPLGLEPLDVAPPLPAIDVAPSLTPPAFAPAPVIGETAPLSLSPSFEPERAPASRLPDLAPSLSISDDEFQDVMPASKRIAVRSGAPAPGVRASAGATAAAGSSAGAGAAAEAADRVAASNLFAAKEAGRDAKPKPVRKGFAWVVGTLTVLAVAGIGGYFWWQLQPRSAGLATPAALLAAAQRTFSPPASGPIAAAPAPAVPAPAVQAAVAPPVAATEPSSPAVAAAAPPAQKVAGARPVRSVPGPRDAVVPTEQPDSPVRITKSHLAVHPLLAGAYDALGRNDFGQAREHYQKVLATDPHDLAALHGMAALAQREARPEQAEYWYKQILVTDPKDTTALAALAELYGRANPVVAESKLRSIAAAFPDASAPQIALGNMLSAQSRWAEAQQAYFSAYAQQPGNPDVLFNLAVSLEHMGKPQIARRYYTEAVQAARHQPAQFDRAVAEERLRALPAN